MRHNGVMMNIFLLFIFNIFTGAVIYLVLSLKIEKTSATFQEKKLKKEMGEIITEFNSTAERNITLLESRISILKKLLNEHGSVKGIDFTVLDDKMKNNYGEEKSIKGPEEKVAEPAGGKVKKKDDSVNRGRLPEEQVNIIESFMDKIQSIRTTEKDETVREKGKKQSVYRYKKETENKFNSSSIIEKTVKEMPVRKNLVDVSADEEIVLTYEEQKSEEPVDIGEMFQNADDKYLLIAKLFNEGHSIEDLSKYSGIPAGEIKLVISLNT